MTSILIGVVGFILTFGIAVFVHEFGHFIFARIRGVGVDAFAIGMGPKIFAFNYKGTEYSLRWFPVGGFVKLHHMLREEAEAEAEATAEERAAMLDEKEELERKAKSLGTAAHEDLVALYDKGLITKLLVFSGGVFFNFLAAIAAFVLIFTIGYREPLDNEAWLGDISPESPIYKAGIRPLDTIIKVDGKEVKNGGEAINQIGEAAQRGAAVAGLDATVRRDGQNVDVKLPALPKGDNKAIVKAIDAMFDPTKPEDMWEKDPIIGDTIPFRPAAKALGRIISDQTQQPTSEETIFKGLKRDDKIIAVNGKPVTRWSEMAKVIRSSPNSAIELTVDRPGIDKRIRFTLVPKEDKKQPGTGVIGIIPGSGKYEHVQEPFFTALVNAPGRAWGRLVWLVVVQVETIRHSSFSSLREEVGGPIAIASITYRYAQKGFRDALLWFINLNLLLAVMNLLPIPVLDGGFIVLSVIEAILRKPVSPKILTPIYTFFVFCFIGLVVLISYQDILNTFF